MPTKKFSYVFYFVLSLFVGILILNTCKQKEKEEELNSLISSLNDSVKTWKDKDSLSHAKISVLETSNIETFLQLKTKDSTISNLQKTVEKYKERLKKGGSVTQVGSETDINTDSETEVIPRDTIIKENEIYIYPEYKSYFNLDSWVYGDVTANKDTTTINLKILNEYDAIIGYEGSSFFKRGKPFVEVISKNPYTELKSLRTYKVSTPPRKLWSIGPSLSYGINQNFEPTFTLSISVQYSLFRF